MDQIINDDMVRDLVPIKDRQKLFWIGLTLIGLYYISSSLEFVYFQEEIGQDLCYFNKKCQHPLGQIKSFNNVLSNIFYIFLGITFILIVKFFNPCVDNMKGLHKDPSLYYAVGVALILEGFCSAVYHICPSKLNFQFDTTFMFIGSLLMFIALYQKRHQDKIPNAFKTYVFMWLIIIVNALALADFNKGVEIICWIIADILIFYTLVLASINIYYSSDWSIDLDLPKKMINGLKNMHAYQYPKLILVCSINLYTIIMIIYAQASSYISFTNWLLSLFVVNMVIYFMYYLVCKIYYQEYIKPYVMILLIINMVIIMTSLLFFTNAVTNKSMTHQESDALNKPCTLFDYWDYHDIWHILSAIGLFMFVVIVYVIDFDLDDLDRHEIHRF